MIKIIEFTCAMCSSKLSKKTNPLFIELKCENDKVPHIYRYVLSEYRFLLKTDTFMSNSQTFTTTIYATNKKFKNLNPFESLVKKI